MMNWCDVVVISIIGIFVLIGLKNGFIFSIFRLASFFISVFVSMKFYPVVSAFLVKIGLHEKIQASILKNLLQQKQVLAPEVDKQAKLAAADSVIIPVQCEYFALEGLGKLLNTIKIVQTRINPDLDIEGILLTMYDSRLRLAKQVVEEVRTHFQQMVFNTIIHRNTRLGEAPSFGETIIMHDADSTGAINYLNLAREILQKIT